MRCYRQDKRHGSTRTVARGEVIPKPWTPLAKGRSFAVRAFVGGWAVVDRDGEVVRKFTREQEAEAFARAKMEGEG